MKLTYKKIAGLIAKEMLGNLSEDERTLLKNWLDAAEDHHQLYDQIKNSGNIQQWISFRESDYQSAWNTVYSSIRKKEKQLRIKKILRVAASFLIPLMVGGGVYWYMSHQIAQNVTPKNQVAAITPGSSRALLLLNDGKSVILDTPDEAKIHEKDGTLILKKEGKINYKERMEAQKEEKEKKDKAVLFNTLHIPRGGEYHLVLSDGTSVYLNAMSELTYPVRFSGKTREVTLKGEAYFEVSQTGTPFRVKTSGMTVEVKGTAFNLNAYEENPTVVTTLVEGKVKVQSAKDPQKYIDLSPSEQAVFSPKDQSMTSEKVDVCLYTGWKDGKLIFYDDRLEDIMKKISRWYSAEIFYLNPSVKDLKFSGSINRYEDIDKILDIIASTQKVGIEVNGKAILFSEKQ